MSERLSNDEFLSALTTLLTTTHSSSHGSVFLTQKPLPTNSATSPSTDSLPSPSSSATATAPSQILIRATNGLSKPHRTDKKLKAAKPKVKLSTVVEAGELETFYGKYAEVCKRGMEGLRKRDKKQKKAKDKAKKKKGKGGKGG